MKPGDLIEMRSPAPRRGIVIECYSSGARKVTMWVVLMDCGRREKIWSSDMRVIRVAD